MMRWQYVDGTGIQTYLSLLQQILSGKSYLTTSNCMEPMIPTTGPTSSLECSRWSSMSWCQISTKAYFFPDPKQVPFLQIILLLINIKIFYTNTPFLTNYSLPNSCLHHRVPEERLTTRPHNSMARRGLQKSHCSWYWQRHLSRAPWQGKGPWSFWFGGATHDAWSLWERQIIISLHGQRCLHKEIPPQLCSTHPS